MASLLKNIRSKNPNVTISLDTNYDSTEEWKGLDDVFPLLDVFLPNEVEAKNISETSDIVQAIDYFSKRVENTVITLGEEGVIAVGKDKTTGKCKEWKQSAFLRTVFKDGDIIDPTGAGDAFNAGFIYGWKKYGHSIPHGLRYGNAMASLCVRNIGACKTVYSIGQVEQVLAQNV